MGSIMCDTERFPGGNENVPRIDRQARRIGIACRMFFFGDQDFEGEATVRDISTHGCKASTSVELTVGLCLRLSLFLPDYNWPLRVDKGIVRWVEGKEFGIEFTDIRVAQRERLRALIMKGKS